MGKLVADITMSLDGFITGPDDAPGRGLGEGGEALHNWVMGGPWRYDDEARRFAPVDVDLGVLQEAMGSIGAGIIGRGMFDVTGGWGGNPPGGPDARYFVLTHSLPAEWADRKSPVLLGSGKRLFGHLGDQPIELQQTRVIESLRDPPVLRRPPLTPANGVRGQAASGPLREPTAGVRGGARPGPLRQTALNHRLPGERERPDAAARPRGHWINQLPHDIQSLILVT